MSQLPSESPTLQLEIVPIEMESSLQNEQTALDDHPWAQFAGMYENNPLFDEVLDSIQAYRDALDADNSASYRAIS